MVGPFKNLPDPTEPFKAKLKPADIQKLILNLKSKNNPNFVEFSKNLLEYTVCHLQKFGEDIFNGFSIEPLPIWSFSENAILKTKDIKRSTHSLPNLKFFESIKLKDEQRKIRKILTSTRISPKTKVFSPAKTVEQVHIVKM